MRVLLIIFVVVPIVELWVLIEVSSQIGAVTTISLLLLTAFFGFHLLRQQGLNTIFRLRVKILENKLPLNEIFEGVIISLGGILLIIPGFLTDTLGFLCLLPKIRLNLIGFILLMIKSNSFGFFNASNSFYQDKSIIDGEYTVDEEEIKK